MGKLRWRGGRVGEKVMGAKSGREVSGDRAGMKGGHENMDGRHAKVVGMSDQGRKNSTMLGGREKGQGVTGG